KQLSHGMPHRLTEGYGISPEHVEAAKAQGVGLIITVDNGIAAHDAADRARALGVDLIVTDHHSLDEGLPHALAVINPKREAPSYTGHHLCGAGVAFKLATALTGVPNDLDIAALGTVADVVPLQGENRVIVALGLRHMARHQRMGLRQLAAAAGLTLEAISAEKIGFQIGPRINAAGRLDDALMALKLFLSDCPEETGRIAKLLNEANQARRMIEQQIFDEAVEELEALFAPEQRSIVLARRGWHPGVIGIVAARVQGRYRRPTAVISIDGEGIGRGSARAGNGFDLVTSLAACQQYLEKFGGHRAAAGLTVREKNLEAFCLAFEEAALAQMGGGELLEELPIDCLAAFSEIDGQLVQTLDQLEPIGHMNPAPLFCSCGVEMVRESVRVLKDQHLKFTARQGDRVFSAIGFGMAEQFYTAAMPAAVDIAYCPRFNTWQGETTIQLILRDIRPAG
ncbi:MAG: single-stranded-DNA-specific exonuclease RecJ, partial [Candidatus Hydrogenedentes bacterium]|nr:single-stranded-DNA-specific exonuclease RecJ [Candidatus Hydrogenedentota bacterium]